MAADGYWACKALILREPFLKMRPFFPPSKAQEENSFQMNTWRVQIKSSDVLTIREALLYWLAFAALDQR